MVQNYQPRLRQQKQLRSSATETKYLMSCDGNLDKNILRRTLDINKEFHQAAPPGGTMCVQ